MGRTSIVLIATCLLLACESETTEPVTTPDATHTPDSTPPPDTTNTPGCPTSPTVKYQLTDANQRTCYDHKGDAIDCPATGENLSGQDAQYTTLAPSYSVTCGDTVVLDERTGLMWEREHHATRVDYATATAHCEGLTTGDFDDWRIPTIKELMSIGDWNGSQHTDGAFYLDGTAFDFDYPDIDPGDLTGSHSNQMMGQTWSSTSRPDSENLKNDTKYFFNFLDAHIKSQSATNPNASLFYRCVRGETLDNDLVDNGDGTVTDQATGRMWQRANGDDGAGGYQFDWRGALSYCEALSLAGHDDWRLPDVKELQSIVDYAPADWAQTRMALDTSVFAFTLPAGKDLSTPPTTSPPDGSSVAPFFWSSTTHGDATSFAAYVCFGPCWAVEDLGKNHDIHGPGAQRSDPKDDQKGNIWDKVGESIGDQKDVVQIANFVRCVRN